MAPTTILAPLQLVTPVLPLNVTALSIDASILPLTIDADTNTTRIEIGIYNTSYVITGFSLVGTFNQFTTSIPLMPTVQETNVTILGRNYDPTFSWQPMATYPIGQRFADPNGNVEVVVQSTLTGQTGSGGPVITATSLVN